MIDALPMATPMARAESFEFELASKYRPLSPEHSVAGGRAGAAGAGPSAGSANAAPAPAGPQGPQGLAANASAADIAATAAAAAASSVSLAAASMCDLAADFPFLRADHAFDASSLAATDAGDRDTSSICLSFAEGDVVFAHWVHNSGWGDVTLLNSGRRGWIPINYFSPFTDATAIPLLSAAANFISAPKSYQLLAESPPLTGTSPNKSPAAGAPVYSFSQAAINEIVSGVRSLLDMTGTLTRNSPMAQRSQVVRRHRKALLTELAYLVSVAKQNKKSTDDAVIEKLVRGTYRIVDKVTVLLDAWKAEERMPSADSQTSLDSVVTSGGKLAEESLELLDSPDASSAASNARSPAAAASVLSSPAARAKPAARRGSRNLHSSVPDTACRLDEVSVALQTYLNVFVHRKMALSADPTASVQVLTNTRHCMLACRELLVVVEAISSAIVPRNPELEWLKDSMFGNIRQLVSAARQMVASLSQSRAQAKTAAERLSGVARECLRLTCECTAWCQSVLEKNAVAIPQRDYPDFRQTKAAAVAVAAAAAAAAAANAGSPAADQGYASGSVQLPPSPHSVSSSDEEVHSANSSMSFDMASPAASGRRARADTSVDSTDSATTDSTTDDSSNDTFHDAVGNDSVLSLPANRASMISSSSGGSDTHDESDRDSRGTSTSGYSAQQPETPEDAGPAPLDMATVAVAAPGAAIAPFAPPVPSFKTQPATLERISALTRGAAPLKLSTRELGSALGSSAELPLTPTTPLDPKPLNDKERRLAALHPELWVRNDRVRAGTLPALVRWLTDAEEADTFSRAAFLLTFRQFTCAKALGEQLVERAGLPGTVEFATLWLESYWRPLDAEAFAQLDALAVRANDEVLTAALAQRRATPAIGQLVERPLDVSARQPSLAGLGSNPAALASQSSIAPSGRRGSTLTKGGIGRRMSHEDLRLAANVWGSALRFAGGNSNGNDTYSKLLDYDPSEIAQQLFRMDAEVLAQLQPDELLDQRFAASKRSLGLAPHVAQLITLSNHLSAFVGDTVLGTTTLSAKARKNIIRQWIRVADKCYEMGNLNAMVTIISTLQSSNIVRLRKIWDLMSAKNMATLERLAKLAAPDRNFADYRGHLRSVTGTPNCMPYIGLYLSDLTLTEEGNPKYRSLQGVQMINFDRYRRVVEVIAGLQGFQKTLAVEPAAGGNVALRNWLSGEMDKSHAAMVQDLDRQWRRSCVIEPKT